MSSLLWGVFSDRLGRGLPLLLSLLLLLISCLGFVTSQSLAAAICWRVFGGAVDGVRTITRAAVGDMKKVDVKSSDNNVDDTDDDNNEDEDNNNNNNKMTTSTSTIKW